MVRYAQINVGTPGQPEYVNGEELQRGGGMFGDIVIFVWGACAGSLITSYFIRRGLRPKP